MLELIAIAVALLGTGLAALQDWKTSFIDEKITYSMIQAGFLLTIMQVLNASIELLVVSTSVIWVLIKFESSSGLSLNSTNSLSQLYENFISGNASTTLGK